MTRVKIVSLIIILLLFVSTACNFEQSRNVETVTTLTPSAITSTITPSGTSFLSPLPTPTVISTSTASSAHTPISSPTRKSINQQAIELLNLKEETFCFDVSSYTCHAIIKVKILDYLHQYPDSLYRQQLVNKIVEFGLWVNPQWIIEEWLTTVILPQLEGKPIASKEMKDFEEKWGQISITDLDNNSETDYLITLRLQDLVCETVGQMYWIYQTSNGYHIELLPTASGTASSYPTILSIDDLTGDGIPELTYIATTCGPSDQFQSPYILSWENDRFINRLVGDWNLINGDFQINEKNEKGIAELKIVQGQTGHPGFAPYSPRQFDIELQRGEYIPVNQISLFQPEKKPSDKDILYWQWANFLLHTDRYIEATDAFNTIAEESSKSFLWVDYRPYALFRLGLSYILLGDQMAAQRSWEQLVTKFPNHPISIDMMTLKDMLKSRDDLGRVCLWLQTNGGEWGQSQWAASENALAYTTWRVYQFEEQSKLNYQEWLESQEPFDYIHARETLNEGIEGPHDYKRLTGWADLCHPMFLAYLYNWTQEEKITTQANQLGLTWETLSVEYDLNNDGTSDPIGVWNINEQLYLWSFISQQSIYQPLSITQPYPIEATVIWQLTTRL